MVMSKVRVGRIFEQKAYKILQDKFDIVRWMSKNKRNTPFDFECENIKGNKIYYGDAKVVKGKEKPFLRYVQRKADFIIVERDGKVEFITKRMFKKRVKIEEELMSNIQLPYKDFSKIVTLKHNLKLRKNSEVIKRMLKLIKYDKLQKELEDLK